MKLFPKDGKEVPMNVLKVGRKFRHDGSLTRHMDYEEKAIGSDSDEETGVTETSINEKVVDDNLTS